MKKTLMLGLSLLLMASTPVWGAEDMIKEGSSVKFDYTLYVEGEVADTSEGKEPLQYTHGTGMIIPGLEAQLDGLKAGDEKKVIVAPEDAYGVVNPQAIVEIPKSNLGEGLDPTVGMVLQMQTKDGQTLNGVVNEIKEEALVMNFNHPLAGKEQIGRAHV